MNQDKDHPIGTPFVATGSTGGSKDFADRQMSGELTVFRAIKGVASGIAAPTMAQGAGFSNVRSSFVYN